LVQIINCFSKLTDFVFRVALIICIEDIRREKN